MRAGIPAPLPSGPGPESPSRPEHFGHIPDRVVSRRQTPGLFQCQDLGSNLDYSALCHLISIMYDLRVGYMP